AVGAERLRPGHEELAILLLLERRVGQRLPEARPAAAAVVLHGAVEEIDPAADAAIHAVALVIVVGAREGPLRARLARDPVGVRRQPRLPLLVRHLHAPRRVVSSPHGSTSRIDRTVSQSVTSEGSPSRPHMPRLDVAPTPPDTRDDARTDSPRTPDG